MNKQTLKMQKRYHEHWFTDEKYAVRLMFVKEIPHLNPKFVEIWKKNKKSSRRIFRKEFK